MKDKLTRKEAKFLKLYLEGKPLAQCAKQAGYKGKDSNSLNSIGSQVLSKLNISMKELLTLTGLTDEIAARTLIEGLNAQRAVVATFQGHIGQTKLVPDPPTRAKFLEIYARIKGHFTDKIELTGEGGGDIVLTIASSKDKKKPLSLNL